MLVTGPTGSGKTTTLAAMINHINQTRACHIITVEDPIEYLHTDAAAAIDQREVGFDTDTFSSAMRVILRQDPDVILVGEMRDPETVFTALTAAETGHLVFSTLHTTTATETVNRIVDFFPPHQHRQIRLSLASALTGTVCQRLIPRADGKGRVPALEVMVVNGRIQQAIADPLLTAEIDQIIADGEYYGMQTFDQALAQLLANGEVDLREAMNAASNPHDLKVMLERLGIVPTGRGFVTRLRPPEALPAGTRSHRHGDHRRHRRSGGESQGENAPGVFGSRVVRLRGSSGDDSSSDDSSGDDKDDGGRGQTLRRRRRSQPAENRTRREEHGRRHRSSDHEKRRRRPRPRRRGRPRHGPTGDQRPRHRRASRRRWRCRRWRRTSADRVRRLRRPRERRGWRPGRRSLRPPNELRAPIRRRRR